MDQLIKHLMNSGIDADRAQEIASGYTHGEENVDVVRLQKALDGVADAMDRDTSGDVDQAIEDAQDIAEAVTRGADALLNEVREQNAALAKGVLAIGEEMRGLRDYLHNQSGAVAAVESQVDAVRKSLTEPVAQKSVTAGVLESPQDEVQADDRFTFLEKSLEELKTCEDSNRQAILRKAVVQVESGVPVAQVQASIRY